MGDKPRAGQGTFAKLYDVQEELTQRNSRPIGRPRKKVRRKPTTVHLTQTESRHLSKMQLLLSEDMSVNRSEIVGVAIEALALLIEENEEEMIQNGNFKSLEGLRQVVFDFIKS